MVNLNCRFKKYYTNNFESSWREKMSSWHAVESWSTPESGAAYSQRGMFPESPCGENVFTDFTCPCWKCQYIKRFRTFEYTRNPTRRRYKEEMERKAATHIQKIWRGFLVRNPTGIPTKEFTESIGKIRWLCESQM